MAVKLALAVLAGTLSGVSASDPPADEYRVKAAFLLNFAKFVEWPQEAFKGPGDPISICVVGVNPFGPGLAAAARDAVVDKRTVSVRILPDAQQTQQCQILFVGQPERKRVRAVLEAAQGASILTVGESEGFIESGGVIEFRVEESKVRMEISAPAARRAGLHISAKLLSLSQPAKR